MNLNEVQVGSTITNGPVAVRITRRGKGTPSGRVEGWHGIYISMGGSGRLTGYAAFIRDSQVIDWWPVPFEWRRVYGREDLEERFAWTPDNRSLVREVRHIKPKDLVCRYPECRGPVAFSERHDRWLHKGPIPEGVKIHYARVTGR